MKGRVAIVAGLPLAAAGMALWDPARHGGPPLCPWRALTGVACPGCGITRAAGALLRGRWDDAVHLHPLVLPVVVQLALVWILALAGTRLRRQPPAWVTPALLAVNGAVFVAVWGLRLGAGSLPTA
jgi:hypothetical protein